MLDRPARAIGGHLATALAMFREMQMPYWVEKAEGALKELGDSGDTAAEAGNGGADLG